LAHGSPENPDQVPEFLKYITGGRPLPATVVEEVRHRYSLIGFSPLACWTLLQADQLSQALGLPVFAGMRNWKPFIKDSVEAIADGDYERVIAICLAPQNSRTSVGLYRSAAEAYGNLPFAMDFVEEWHDEPLLIKAFAEKLRAGWEKASQENGGKVPVIFTAHSVPARTISDGDPYERQAKETAELVAKEAGLGSGEWRFAFQSQGMSGGAWIGPTVEETIRNLKAEGHRGVFIHPVGFLCDHVEILYDIDIAFKEVAQNDGMRVWRAESLNGSETLTAALAALVNKRTNVAMSSNRAKSK
jgi:ferrochelatase